MKPSDFSEVEDWYRSILDSLTAKSLFFENNKKITHVYKTVFHGFSARLASQQVQELKKRPEIVGVIQDRKRHIQITRSPGFLGLTTATKTRINDLRQKSNYGSNVIIGVLDTGLWPEGKSFQDHGLDPIPSRWKGECVGGEDFPKSLCNKKLIGARYFRSEELSNISARDHHGHGTHTSSTIAGHTVNNASFLGFANGEASGMAEKARLAVYKVCWNGGQCMESDILAGLDKAVEDGVDVISISLGSGRSEPYFLDPIAIGSFGAMEKGVFVSAAAGNSGFRAETVDNVAPWMITVGASTIDRKFPADVVLEDGTTITGSSLYNGKQLPNKTYFPLIYAGSTCMYGSLDQKLIHGKIVVCDRGDIGCVDKGIAVKKAGGVGMIVANTESSGEGLIADAHLFPGLAITLSAREKVLNYINSTKNPRATMVFHKTQLGAKPAPVVAVFSSRGPNPQSIYIVKPDVIAPGVDILAAWTNDSSPSGCLEDTRRAEFNIISGTSMSCPHVSGLAALLKAAHLDWSPAMIKSALMTTAYTQDEDGNPLLDEKDLNQTNIWAMGAGHVDPQKALDPGLVYDLTAEDYIDFLCASSYSLDHIQMITRRSVNCSLSKIENPWDLNYPIISIAFDDSKSSNSEGLVTRTVTHVSETASTYKVTIINPEGVSVTVDPEELEFEEKSEKQSYKVKISIKEMVVTDDKVTSKVGKLVWTDGKHNVTSPIVVTWTELA
ncbi:hypothetical protein Patl1_06086 [Pistacia atlantica]|uniref:Uncharacterized protein n=1 Tax=Pistacia atlantica TaxID=434234 RepID=A0ACC1BTA8_9ROSI|nr:hypothetical protein Patl1_06086 [Pistacia atlantica]